MTLKQPEVGGKAEDVCAGSRAKTALCLFLMSLGIVPSSMAQSAQLQVAEANPGRPTVSTPATLTPVGHLQFETGGVGASHSPEFSSRYGLNEVVKISVARRLELIAAAEPLVHYDAAGTSANGTAEVFLGAQAVVSHGEGARPTISASYFRRAFDGGLPDVDIGSPLNSFVALASADVKGFHYDANAIFNEQTEGTGHRAQFGQTLSVAHHIAGKFSVSGEIWHFTQPFLHGNAVGSLWAVGYAVGNTSGARCGFQSRADEHVYALGRICGVHVSAAAPIVVRDERLYAPADWLNTFFFGLCSNAGRLAFELVLEKVRLP